jgi:hypothetical protein
MKLTLGQLQAVATSPGRNQDGSPVASSLDKLLRSDLPITIMFKLKRLVAAITPELQEYERLRVELVKNFGSEQKDQQGTWNVDQDKMQAFSDEMAKLNATTVQIPFEPIPVHDLCNATLNYTDALVLEPFITE